MHIKLELLKNEITDLILNNIDNIEIDADNIADSKAISALSEIQCVIQNDDISDFDIVEEIIKIFEKYNISAGSRHDFGLQHK